MMNQATAIGGAILLGTAQMVGGLVLSMRGKDNLKAGAKMINEGINNGTLQGAAKKAGEAGIQMMAKIKK